MFKKTIYKLLNVFILLILIDCSPSSERINVTVKKQAINLEHLSPEAALKMIVRLEKQMLTHAQNMEFEQAALIRDQIIALTAQLKR